MNYRHLTVDTAGQSGPVIEIAPSKDPTVQVLNLFNLPPPPNFIHLRMETEPVSETL
jgi:hypothetical protein